MRSLGRSQRRKGELNTKSRRPCLNNYGRRPNHLATIMLKASDTQSFLPTIYTCMEMGASFIPKMIESLVKKCFTLGCLCPLSLVSHFTFVRVQTPPSLKVRPTLHLFICFLVYYCDQTLPIQDKTFPWLIMLTSMKLEKFEGNAFHTWQTKVKFTLMRKGIWNIIKLQREKGIHQR